jgi:hypothetical protein
VEQQQPSSAAPPNKVVSNDQQETVNSKESDSLVDPAQTSNAQTTAEGRGNSCNKRQLPLNVTQMPDGTFAYSFNFVVYIAGEDCEGLYSLYFHNCASDDIESRISLDMNIVEENQDDSRDGHNYLSAGETPLPALYLMMSILFFIAGCFWVLILKKSR